MESYTYRVITPEGKEKKGTLDAETKNSAARALKGEGNTIIFLEEANFLSKDIDISFAKKVKPRDLSVFCRQFVSIISAGVSIVKALSMLEEQTENKRLKAASKDVMMHVEKGETLTVALRRHEDIFSPLMLSMVEAGEASGSLDVAFTRMATQYEKDAKLNAVVKKALIYPVIVGIVAVGVIVVMMLVVIPNFMTMFEDMDIQMPAITMLVVGMSDFFVAYWYIIFAVFLILFVGIKTYKSTNSGKKVFDTIYLKIPIVNNFIIKSSSARFARNMSTLLASGVSIVEALKITAGTMSNVIYREAVEDTIEKVEKGVAISVPLREAGVFPPMLYHMIGIGEETGTTENMLNNVADYFDEEVQNATEQMTAALEPLIIVVLALVVGTIIMAIMSPMLTMYDALGTL